MADKKSNSIRRWRHTCIRLAHELEAFTSLSREYDQDEQIALDVLVAQIEHLLLDRHFKMIEQAFTSRKERWTRGVHAAPPELVIFKS